MKKALVILLCVAMLFSAAACDTTSQNTRGATFNGKTIYMDELRFYIYYNQYLFEEDAGDLIETMFSSKDSFWKTESGDGTYFDELVKADGVELLQTNRIMCAEAEKNGVTLNEEELAAAESEYETFMKNPGNVLTYADGVSDEIVHQFFLDLYLAEKYEATLTDDVDTEIDPSVTLRKIVEGANVVAKTNAPENEDGTEGRAYTEVEKKQFIEDALKKMRELFDEGKAPLEVYNEFTSSETVTVFIVYNKILQADNLDSGEDKEIYFKDAWNLTEEDGLQQFSYVRSDGITIYYLLRMLDPDSDEERAKAEAEILEERKAALLAEKTAELQKKYSFYVRKATFPDITYMGAAIGSTTE